MRVTLIIFIVFIAEIAKSQNDFECLKWEVIDIPFLLDRKIESPYQVVLGAVFTDPSGTRIDIPGFYNGNNEWIVRFCPNKIGRWRYITYSTLHEFSSVEGEVIAAENINRKVHGPIVISKMDKQKFQYSDGTPYFMMAFELDWLFALDAENKDDIPRTKEIISEISKNGFNQIVMNVYAYDASWGEKDKISPEHDFSKPNIFPFLGSNSDPDYSALNIDFFKHFDRVIAYLNESSIISHLMIYVWNKQVNWPAPGSAADNMYFDYVVKRYQAYPNLVWDISKEALAYGRDDMNYITERIDRLRKLDGHGRLLTVHDYAYCSAFPDKVDFISIQEWRPNIYNEMIEKVKIHTNKPIVNIEHGGYEKSMYSIFNGAYTNPEVCLDRNYKCAFAGAYSTYYWQNSSWYNIVYNISDLPDENQPKLIYYKNFTDFFSKYDFTNLSPEQYFFSTYCLTDNEKLYLFYASDGVEIIQGQLKDIQNKTVSIQWFNPLNGEYTEIERREFNKGDWLHFPKPGTFGSDPAIAIIEFID